MKKYLYVTQLSSEPGTDIAWTRWLVLSHDENMGDVQDQTWRRIDKLLAEVTIELIDPSTEDYKDPADLVDEITPALEAKGFEVIGLAEFAFSKVVG